MYSLPDSCLEDLGNNCSQVTVNTTKVNFMRLKSFSSFIFTRNVQSKKKKKKMNANVV